MALYRENGVNPTGGCLPMFLQFPILIVLYDVVRGLSKTADILNAKGQKIYLHGKLQFKATPQNIRRQAGCIGIFSRLAARCTCSASISRTRYELTSLIWWMYSLTRCSSS